MNWFEYTVAHFRLAQLVFWKRLGFALTGTVLPLGLGIALSVRAKQQDPIAGVPADLYVLTGFLGFSLFFVVYNLVNSVTSRRDALIYKRLRGTALPDSSIFIGEGASASVVSCGVAVILAVFGVAGLGSGLPFNIPLLALGILLGATMFAMLAVGVSGILPSAEMSVWITTPVMVFLMMCSGIFIPLSSLPGPLGTVAAYLPLAPVVSIVRTSYFGRDFASHSVTALPGAKLDFLGSLHVCLSPIGVTVAWAAIGLWLARRCFRWDPKRTG
ncbi:ABC transporter permease [Kitasatospora sp. NPDC056531]|uniref:ABC transporter permease n=1 Tax=Kitasatospora sp. NPDC056531 TaxID=3345856 RepID=UPI0036802044